MKKIIATFIIATLSTLCLTAQNLTFASYNIRNGVGIDNKRDLDRTAGVLLDLGADIIAIQEVDSVTGRSGGVDVLRVLAEKTGMHRIYGQAINYDGGGYGVGLLSKAEPTEYKVIALPGREERRALIVADYGKFVFMATHLSLTGADQLRSLEIIDSVAGEFEGRRVFVAGDFNFEPDGEQFELLRRNFWVLSSDEKTFPANKPKVRIDYVTEWKNGGEECSFVVEKGVVDAPFESDHRPIKVKIKE